MTGGSRIYDLRASCDAVDPPADTAESAIEIEEEAALPEEPAPQPILDDEDEADGLDRAPRWPIVLAVVVCLAWLGSMLWLAAHSLQAGIEPIQLAEFIAALCVPPVLIGIIWLLALRTSTAEARRFGRTAAAKASTKSWEPGSPGRRGPPRQAYQ